MRIAIIAPPWVAVPPRAYGGTEAVLDSLARGLQNAGHDVLLYTTGDSSCPVPRSSHFDEAVGIGRPGGALLEMRHVMAAYQELSDFDIVHDHTLAGPIYAAGFFDGVVVTTNHGPFGEGLDEYYRAISPRIPVIAISHHQAESANGIVLAGVIHHGVEVNDFPYGNGEGDYALFLGRISPAKGVHTAAQVAIAAGIRIIIAGKCTEAAEIAYFEQKIKPLLSKDVEFVGEADRQAKLALLSEARCLLNPIAWPEPFGMVMLESLACGTPVITTRNGAAPEIVEDGITGVLANDHLALVDAVGKATSLDRSACRKAAVERFSVERMVTRHLAVYETAIHEHAARRASIHR